MPARGLACEGSVAGLIVLLAVAAATAGADSRGGGEGGRPGVERFAALTFGSSGVGALGASAEQVQAAVTPAPPECPTQPPDVPPIFVTRYRAPNGWLLRPAGCQKDTSRAPTGISVSPDSKTVLVVNSGIFEQKLEVIDAQTLLGTAATASDLYMGVLAKPVTDLPDGPLHVFASGGNRNRVYQFLVQRGAGGAISQVGIFPGTPDRAIPVVGYPGNMALSADGTKLYVVGNLSIPQESKIQVTDLAARDCLNGEPSTPEPICSVINVLENFTGPVPTLRLIPVGRDAFGIVLHAGAARAYVTNWADHTNTARAGGTGTLSVIDLSNGAETVVPVGRHPTGVALSPDRKLLAAANSEDDTVSVFNVAPDGALSLLATRSVKTSDDAPPAATPLAAAFSPDTRYLFVALAGQNAVQVLNADGTPIPRTVMVQGTMVNVPHTYIPTGWYPSAMASAPHPDPSSPDTRLYVANLKGIGAGPGLNGQAEPLMGSRTQGTLSVIDIPADLMARNQKFNQWTATVVENNDWVPLLDTTVDSAAADTCLPAPLPGGGQAFSELLCAETRKVDPKRLHVVYIVKENKTFDQYFGDLRSPPGADPASCRLADADADPTWLLYGEDVTTNQHRLACTFTLSDMFWADSEQSTTGHSWTSALYATEHNEITWNTEYDQGIRGARWAGQYEGQFTGPRNGDIAEQEGEMLEPEERFVDLLADSARNPLGLTFRIYSDDVNDGTAAEQQRVPLGLWGIGSSAVHHGRDLDFPDTDRARMFIEGHTISNAWSSDQGEPPPSFGKEIGFCGAPDDPSVVNAPEAFCDRPGASLDEYENFALGAWIAEHDQCVAEVGSCSDFSGNARGLCDAYCKAHRCHESPTSSCEQLRKNFAKTTGSRLFPCDRLAECQSAMPNFIYMALPVDHTIGFNPLMPTPASMVADNDSATGEVVEALSKSPFWKNTLILITEDDTQLAGDHVDAHRTFLLAAGGLARRYGQQRKVSHQEGSFPSILKTVEALFALEPLTIYDRAAVPLHDVVIGSLADRNDVVYEAVEPQTSFARNPEGGVLATLSLKLDWTLDRPDPCVMTGIIYAGERGWPLPECALRLLRDG